MSVTEARASTRDRWHAWSLRWRRRVPCCHSGGQAPGWGMGGTWRAGVADVEETELQERGPAACTCPLGMKGGSGVRDTREKPALPPRRSPLTPGSCWLWSGWPSSDRPSCLHGSCAGGYMHVPAPCSGPGDPSPPRSLSSGSGPHCPRSLPSPPLDSSDSRQGTKKTKHKSFTEYTKFKISAWSWKCFEDSVTRAWRRSSPHCRCSPASGVVTSPDSGWSAPVCVSPSQVWRTVDWRVKKDPKYNHEPHFFFKSQF